jgi:hypothetical protein
MRLREAFDTFYDAISLDAKPTEKIESASHGLKEHLVSAYGLAKSDIFLQGSYPNGTAVAPEDRDSGEYDVDLVAICAAPGGSANAVLDDLAAKLSENAMYRRLIRQEGSRKKPCVRLRYADDEVGGFHVDVVPARVSQSDDSDAPLEVPRRDEGWHDTAPLEYTEWCRKRGERFARTVMMLKRWRDVHQSARQSVKSIVLQVLAAQGLGSHRSDGDALVETLSGMRTALAPHPDSAPVVTNPVMPAENLAARWEDSDYRNFLGELDEALVLGRRALESEDREESHKLWRQLLGGDFPAAPTDLAKRTGGPPATPAPGYERLKQETPRRERYG